MNKLGAMKIIKKIEEVPVFELTVDSYKLKVYGNIFSNKLTQLAKVDFLKFISSPESFIKGDYCFELNAEDILYLGSSRSATHPIYFRRLNNSIIYSTKFKNIVEASQENSLSTEAAYQFLTYEYIADPLTLVEGVYKVPSACVLTVKDDLTFKLSEFEPQISSCNENQNSISEFKDYVYRAHENRISTNNTLLLSGGVDSCISAIVLKDVIKNDDLNCYTFSTLNAEQDEYAEAKFTADYLGLNVNRVVVDPNQAVDLEELVNNANFFYPGAIMISAIAKQAGENTNFFACQDTRLHTPALNPLDKLIFSATPFKRELLSKVMSLFPGNIAANSIVNKVINRGRIASDLPKYIESLFFHKHDINLGQYTSDSNFNTSLESCIDKKFTDFKGSSRQIYNEIVQLAWHRQYSDDIQYLVSTTAQFGSQCQMPWYDEELAFNSAQLPMREATRFVKGRAGHSSKSKKVNKYILRNAFSGLLPDEILFRDKAVCVTNHLFLKGVYKPYIEGMKINSLLFNTKAGSNLKIQRLFESHYSQYMNYQIADYNQVVEMQNIVALELYCKVYSLT
jgi:asparagine synthetase B (glutamine-hydrolysing)